MELELKHLAAYLPYGLRVEVLDYKSDYVNRQYDEIVGFHQWDRSGKLWSVLTLGGAKPSIKRVKPILRPLSQYFGKTGKQVMDELNCSLDVVHEIWELVDGAKLIEQLSVKTHNIMCENHIDFHRLIDADLTVDINTIEPCTT